jgi:hypothetical protein
MQFAASLGETAGVYHFGLECPSGKLSGFLAFVKNPGFPWETPWRRRVAIKSKVTGETGEFRARSGLKLGYSVKTCSISVSCAKNQTSFVNV